MRRCPSTFVHTVYKLKNLLHLFLIDTHTYKLTHTGVSQHYTTKVHWNRFWRPPIPKPNILFMHFNVQSSWCMSHQPMPPNFLTAPCALCLICNTTLGLEQLQASNSEHKDWKDILFIHTALQNNTELHSRSWIFLIISHFCSCPWKMQLLFGTDWS